MFVFGLGDVFCAVKERSFLFHVEKDDFFSPPERNAIITAECQAFDILL